MAKSNLIPNSERSPEELREMGRKRGKEADRDIQDTLKRCGVMQYLDN